MALSAPEPLDSHHQLGEFNSGVAALDDWLKRRAFANQASGASRTFVVGDAARVIGYYALAAGAVTAATVPGRFRRNMPEPIPRTRGARASPRPGTAPRARSARR